MSDISVPTFAVVVLTMGQRPEALARALGSVTDQQGVKSDVVVVGNGWRPLDLPDGVKSVHLLENAGIPAGRNAGVRHVSGDFLLFLDDDSWLIGRDFLRQTWERLAANDALGMIQPRIVDPSRPGEEPLRWIPRIHKGHPERSSVAFSVLETAVVIPRSVFERAGGWPGSFFYAHEGIELAWRVWDQGLCVEYHGDLQVGHPVVEPTRHEQYYYFNARNRVWLARRCLPWPLGWIYVINWTAIQLLRTRELRPLRVWMRGWHDGWRETPWKGQAPLKHLPWRTVARMARHGRLLIV